MRGWLAHDSIVGGSTDLADLMYERELLTRTRGEGSGRGMAIIHSTTVMPASWTC